MKKLIIADYAGFCFGVARSVKIATTELKNKSAGRCVSLGQLIHNNDVISELEKEGLGIITAPEEAQEADRVIIRAHGVDERSYSVLKEKNAAIIDATCPKVAYIHQIVSEASDSGRFVIILGMNNHPEVNGICGWCSEYCVVENAAEARQFLDDYPQIAQRPITFVSQTTQTENNYKETCEELKKRCTNLEISDTICKATILRQTEAVKLASVCDAMVVIGGKNSANSSHLAEICKNLCRNVQFIEKSDELDFGKLAAVDTVGLTAGASTPSWIIKEVSNKMSDVIKNAEINEAEMSFDQMLEESLKPIYNGDKVTGVVVAISGTEISVELGTKYSGIIPTSEFTDDGTKLEDAVKVGDEIEAVVVRVNDVEGTATLSKKRLDSVKAWAMVEEAVENGAIVEGVVTEENKGGVVVNVKGVRVFVPASQTDLPRDAELSQLLKKVVRLKITEANRARKRVVGSIRRVAQAERREKIEQVWNEMEKGKQFHGVVKSLTSYGAFVDIGGIDGMVHVSELSWGRIHQPSEVVAVGDELDVYVIDFDKEKRKISLGYKDPNGNPWSVFTSKYEVGSVASVKVVKLMDFGAFAEVVPGVDGLIHISQIADHRINKPGDELNVGDVIDVKITAIDEEKHKVSLSRRALIETVEEEAPVEE